MYVLPELTKSICIFTELTFLGNNQFTRANNWTEEQDARYGR